MNENVPPTLKDLKAAVKRGEEACAQIRYDHRAPLHQATVGFMLWVVESASSIEFLLRSGRAFDCKTLLRPMIECWVELELLNVDADHIWNIQFDFCKHVLMQLEEAQRGNPIAAEIAKKPAMMSAIGEWKQKKENCYNKGGRSLKVENKFNKLKLSDEYEMIYRSLSQSVHSTFAGVVARSFKVDFVDDTYEAILYRQLEPESVDVIIDTSINLIDRCIDLSAKLLLPITHPSSAQK